MSTIYDDLRSQLVAEKSSYHSSKQNQYTFVVANTATRTQVKDAIETLYDVKVVRVNVINVPAKRGRRLRSRRLLVRKVGYKKAVITLADGQTLQIFEGVQ